MWFNELYFNRRDWMLSKYKQLGIDAHQFLILCVIDAANQNNLEITHDYLVEETGLTKTQMDKHIQKLIEKKYLKIKPSRKKIDFNIDGVFNQDLNESTQVNKLLGLFEDSFGRLLSQQELQTLISLQNKVEYDTIIYALRQAIIHSKLSMSYVEKVALNESNKND